MKSSKKESLSLIENEKKLIIRALIKNDNNREAAAIDLEISIRTLYRKIKQYGLMKYSGRTGKL